MAHAGIESEPGERLKQEGEKGKEINHAGERVVSHRHDALRTGLQYIHLHDFHHFLPLRAMAGNEVGPLCIGVTNEAPVDAHKKIEEEHETRHEVDESNCAEPVLLVGLA